MKFCAVVTQSASRPNVAIATPMHRVSRPDRLFLWGQTPKGQTLGRVEEAAALEQACALFRRHFDVAWRQQEDLVGDALHAAVQGVREPAGEVDQALGELL